MIEPIILLVFKNRLPNLETWKWCILNIENQIFKTDACYETEVCLKTGTWCRVPCRPHHGWGRRENVGFYTYRLLEIHIPKLGKYSIINKTTTFAPFLPSLPQPLAFTSFLQESWEWNSWKSFPGKPKFQQKQEKSHVVPVTR